MQVVHYFQTHISKHLTLFTYLTFNFYVFSTFLFQEIAVKGFDVFTFSRQKVKVGCPRYRKQCLMKKTKTELVRKKCLLYRQAKKALHYKIQNLHLLFTPFFPFRSFLYCSFSLLISPWSTSQTSAVGDRSSLSTCSILLKEKKSAIGNASCWRFTIIVV